MEQVIATIIAIGLAWAFDRWKYARSIAKGAELVLKSPLGGVVPKSARDIAVQAIILANQSEIERVMAHVEELQAEGKREELEALERGRANAEGMNVEIIDRTGDESWSKPFKDDR